MTTLYITVGLPGSGKTTWARELLAARPLGSMVRVNRDDLRAMALPLGYRRPLISAEIEISMMQHTLISTLLRRGVDVVVDDTNLVPDRRESLEKTALGEGAQVMVNREFLGVPVEECVRRDALRGQPVGKEVIWRMHYGLAATASKEG